MKSTVLRRFAPALILASLSLVHCGGTDNTDLDLDGDGAVRDSGKGGGLGDSGDAARNNDGSSCPTTMPTHGQPCPAGSLVCTYGDQMCVCSVALPWTCMEIFDAGSSPDAGRPDGGSSLPDAAPDTGRQDGSTGVDVRDAGRDAALDAVVDARDAGRDPIIGRDVNTRDVVDARTVDTRDAGRDNGVIDVANDASSDLSSDDVSPDNAAPEGGDDGTIDDAGDSDGG